MASYPMIVKPCPSCGHGNELPYLFCGDCGGPRLKPGRWLIIIDLWLAMVVFLGIFGVRNNLVLKDFMIWDWPVYLLYGFFLFQFSLPLIAGIGPRRAGIVIGWLLTFLAVSLVCLEIISRFGAGALIQVLIDLPDFVTDSPIPFYSILGFLLAVIFIPAYVRWRRAFGWVMAYRLVLLALFALSLCLPALLALTAEIVARHPLPALDFVLKPLLLISRPKYDHVLLTAALIIGRILLFEIWLFASISGYSAACHFAPLSTVKLNNETGFVRSMLMLAHTLRRIAHIFEQMARFLFTTVMELSRDLLATLYVFVREILLAIVSLITVCVGLYWLMRLTVAYIEDNQPLILAQTFLALASMMAGSIVFLGCKTHLRWRRIITFFLQLTGWLLPNLLVFFLLLSLSLYASSKVINRFWNLTQELPYRLGWLSIAISGILVGLLVIVFLRKGSQLTISAAADAQLEQVEPIALPADTRPAVPAQAAALTRSARPGRLSRLFQIGRVTVDRWFNARPYLANHLSQAQTRLRAKTQQLEALEQNKAIVRPELYQQLHAQYLSDLRFLHQELEQARLKVEDKYSSKFEAIGILDGTLNMLNGQVQELEQLHRSGVIPEAEYRRQLRPLRAQIEQVSTQIEATREFLRNLKTKSPELVAEAPAKAEPTQGLQALTFSVDEFDLNFAQAAQREQPRKHEPGAPSGNDVKDEERPIQL